MSQLEALATKALAGSQSHFRKWWLAEVDKVAAKLMWGEEYLIIKPFRRLLRYPSTIEQAKEMARKEIEKYHGWSKPDEAVYTNGIAEKWLGVAKNVTMFEGFTIPKRDFDFMVHYAALAPQE